MSRIYQKTSYQLESPGAILVVTGGKSYKALAPTRPMLKLPRAEYDEQFDAILAELDPAEIYAELGENAVLLCWEKPGDWCHRRRVAEWLEEALGVEITEYGFERNEVPPYVEMPEATK